MREDYLKWLPVVVAQVLWCANSAHVEGLESGWKVIVPVLHGLSE